MGGSALTGKILRGQNNTAVKEHLKQCISKVSFENFEILFKDSTSEYNLMIKESLYIHRENPILNIQGNSIPLTLFKN